MGINVIGETYPQGDASESMFPLQEVSLSVHRLKIQARELIFSPGAKGFPFPIEHWQIFACLVRNMLIVFPRFLPDTWRYLPAG